MRKTEKNILLGCSALILAKNSSFGSWSSTLQNGVRKFVSLQNSGLLHGMLFMSPDSTVFHTVVTVRLISVRLLHTLSLHSAHMGYPKSSLIHPPHSERKLGTLVAPVQTISTVTFI